ncbi:MAG: hypothetical protein ACHQUC_08140 [Chlamydiales bacterium]
MFLKVDPSQSGSQVGPSYETNPHQAGPSSGSVGGTVAEAFSQLTESKSSAGTISKIQAAIIKLKDGPPSEHSKVFQELSALNFKEEVNDPELGESLYELSKTCQSIKEDVRRELYLHYAVLKGHHQAILQWAETIHAGKPEQEIHWLMSIAHANQTARDKLFSYRERLQPDDRRKLVSFYLDVVRGELINMEEGVESGEVTEAIDKCIELCNSILTEVPAAKYTLATLLLRFKKSVDEDRRGVDLLLQCAAEGIEGSNLMLGTLFEEGLPEVLEKDLVKAYLFYTKEKGDEEEKMAVRMTKFMHRVQSQSLRLFELLARGSSGPFVGSNYTPTQIFRGEFNILDIPHEGIEMYPK